MVPIIWFQYIVLTLSVCNTVNNSPPQKGHAHLLHCAILWYDFAHKDRENCYMRVKTHQVCICYMEQYFIFKCVYTRGTETDNMLWLSFKYKNISKGFGIYSLTFTTWLSRHLPLPKPSQIHQAVCNIHDMVTWKKSLSLYSIHINTNSHSHSPLPAIAVRIMALMQTK